MKRLAAGIVLFLVSFSIPAPGSADLVFFTQGLDGSINKFDDTRSQYYRAPQNIPGNTEKSGVAGLSLHAAPQQFNPVVRADSSVTPLPARPGTASMAISGFPMNPEAGQLPTVPEFAEWLLVLVGFALGGIALRNRSNSGLDERNPAFSRLPSDI